MSRKFVSALSAAALLLAAPVSTFARAEPAPAAAPGQPSARALALAERYVAAIHMDQNFAKIMTPLGRMLMDEFKTQGVTVSPEFSKALQESMVESGTELMKEMLKRITPQIARIYTEDELQAMVDFYESPVGQSILAKTGQVTEASAAIMPDLMPAYQADMQRRLCTKIDCNSGPYKKFKPASAT